MKPKELAAVALAVACLLVWPLGVAGAATIFQVDFDGMTTGTTTETALDAATTGGTWDLNSASNALHYIMADNSGNGDLAFFSHAVSANQWGAQVILDNPVDIDADLASGNLTMNFETATGNSTGYERNAYWKLYDGTTKLAEIMMDDGKVYLKGSTGGYSNLGALSAAPDPNKVYPWNSTSAQVFSVGITVNSGGLLDLTMSRDSGSITVSGSTNITSTANFDRIETSWKNKGGTMGVYLNDITFEIPSPAIAGDPASGSILDLGSVLVGGAPITGGALDVENTGDVGTTLTLAGFSALGGFGLYSGDPSAVLVGDGTTGSGPDVESFLFSFDPTGKSPGLYTQPITLGSDAGSLEYTLQAEVFGAAVIPEPSTLAIWSLGPFILLWYSRRRRR